MCKQILPTSTIRNIWRTVRRTCMLILGLKGLRTIQITRNVVNREPARRLQ